MPPLKAVLGTPFHLHPQLLCSVARISGDHGASSCQVSVTPGFSPPKSWDVVALALLVLVAGGLQLSPGVERTPLSAFSLCHPDSVSVQDSRAGAHTCMPGSRVLGQALGTGKDTGFTLCMVTPSLQRGPFSL